ncbi:23S rRNA pseudouridine(955/2504/2580) synthase RluC [Nitrincola sp. MINF-07-Sa-05]|uniref:23S rRNA pseudouridine(955/2504/2580) synthase RluC n=1 Tax=Nitrincola salilacus TaxID=3400273 RepID=UPI00391821E5
MTNSDAKSRPQVRYVTVEPEQEGQRIDNFLRTQLKGVPKTLIYRVLRKGEIRVNKKRAKPDYKLVSGDEVRIPPVRVSEPNTPEIIGRGFLDRLESAILYETDALMVINKPSGLAVHGGSGITSGLIEAVRQMRPDARFLELVHRIDRDTSGCLMIAKKRSMLRHLHEGLRERQIKKVYQALVVGRWEKRQQRVDAPLLRNELQSGERMVRVDNSGKSSITDFRLLRRFGDLATLVEASPLTGRTHQIRVHCQFAGHPIIGDTKYGDERMNQQMKAYGIHRLMLHAAEIRARLPDGEMLVVKAELDMDLATLLADHVSDTTS